MTGTLSIVGLGPGPAHLDHPGGNRRAGGRQRPRRLPALPRPHPQRAGQSRHGSDNRAEMTGHARPGDGGTKAARSRSSPAAIPASSPWPPRSSKRSKPASQPGAALDITVVPGDLRHAGRRRSAWCAAGTRFLCDLAVRQPEALGHRRPAPARRRRRRFRHRAVQPGVQSPPGTRSTRPSNCCAAARRRPPRSHSPAPSGARTNASC